MKVQTVTVMQRRNMGNYEHLEISLTAQLDDSKDSQEQIYILKGMVESALYDEKMDTTPVEAKEEVKEEVKPEPTPAKKAKATKAKAEKVEEKKDELAEATQPELPIEEEVEAPKEEKKSKTKFIAYNREDEGHKAKLSSYLNTNFPKWKTFKDDAHKAQVLAFTKSLNGKDFMEASGEIAESFKETLSGFFA